MTQIEYSSPRPALAIPRARAKWIAAAVATLVLALLAAFVWPTMYSYRELGGQVLRVNRVSQKVSRLSEYGWQPVDDEWPPKVLPPSAFGPAPAGK